MKKMSTKDIQRCELNLLKIFENLCEKNNLYYTLGAGTLLGAIRHKGFIPWDDDIDVLMPRADYEKMINGDIDCTGLPEYIKIKKWKDGSLSYPFIKLVDIRTIINSEYLDSKYDVRHIWIDIFPLDAIPNTEEEHTVLFNSAKHIRQILQIKQAKIGQGKTWWKRILKPVLKVIYMPFKIENLCRKMDEVSKQYNFAQSIYIRQLVWATVQREHINREKYMLPIKVEFEGQYFNAPSNYDEYLSIVYGDYMKLPPEDKRRNHNMEAYFMDK